MSGTCGGGGQSDEESQRWSGGVAGGSEGRDAVVRDERGRSESHSSAAELNGRDRPVVTSSTTPVMPARLLR
jgi:hypothetical protein